MGAESLFTLVGTLGFPVAICLILIAYIAKRDAMHKEEVDNLSAAYQAQVKEMVDNHHKECTDFANALNNNTVVMKQILEHMRKG